MIPGIFHIAFRSVIYHRRKLIQQILIIALLASIITGSLLTGYSVKETLKRSVRERLGNTRLIVSSGLRYSSPELASRLQSISGNIKVPILETEGFVQRFAGNGKSQNIKIIGVGHDFFTFQGIITDTLHPGEAIVNSNLATKLGIGKGDEIILNFNPPDDIPGSSPFSNASSSGNSMVLRVGVILDSQNGGDFTTSITQSLPDNVFISLDEEVLKGKINRILSGYEGGTSAATIESAVKKVLRPSDIGLRVRTVKATGEREIVSSRIFIDQALADEIKEIIPDAKPVISYLYNSFTHNSISSPYSFASGIGDELPDSDEGITVNEWLANDLGLKTGDSAKISWYDPASNGKLLEKSSAFVIRRIVAVKGAAADSMLMPEFPGIAGSVSCSRWNAGVEIKTERIRKKDEEYWSMYRGTPKVFMSYSLGKKLWGNNFGPLTAIRIQSRLSENDITEKLTGSIAPGSAGFTVRNIYSEMKEAASKSVDFSSLFISLGFFIIVSCIIILLLSVNTYLETRKKELSLLRSIGFRQSLLLKYLVIEAGLVTFAGSLAGCFSGMIFNFVVVRALNTVWTGAVQTSALTTYSGVLPILSGFTITYILSLLFIWLDSRKSLNNLTRKQEGGKNGVVRFINRKTVFASSLVSLFLLILNFFLISKPVLLPFVAGIFLLISSIGIWGLFVKSGFSFSSPELSAQGLISGRYFSFHSGSAIMPVLLIAAGLFAVVITGVNRLKINSESLNASGGTGGYRYWIDAAVPIREDLNSAIGRKKHGLGDLDSNNIRFIQFRRSTGNDASCLNLNYIAAPPLLGVDPADFTANKAFSFSSLARFVPQNKPWSILIREAVSNTVYGFADQTVLEWGLKKGIGDTLKFRSESGAIFNVVIAGGLRSSVFQGYLLIGSENFNKYYPSVPGYSNMLVRVSSPASDSLPDLLRDRLDIYNISVLKASDRLATFFTVTNTYLEVFTALGFLGMILGVTGLGLVLIRLYYSRRREFAILMATGFTLKEIRRIIIREQAFILAAGILSGVVPGLVAASGSVQTISGIPWMSVILIIIAVSVTGILSILFSVRGIDPDNLVSALRKE